MWAAPPWKAPVMKSQSDRVCSQLVPEEPLKTQERGAFASLVAILVQ